MSRPATGTGGHHVRLSISNKRSWRLLIGKELWRAAGSPARLELARTAKQLHITPTVDEGPGKDAISGAATGVPRLTVAAVLAREVVRLQAPHVFENCRILNGEILVVV